MRDRDAHYYKLTPPLTLENLRRGHGFHFTLPGSSKGEVFLDVMGNPPRVDPFSASTTSARQMETEWGVIPTIGLKALVELKKTQRLEDYPIISKLALAWFDQPECRKTADDFLWALQNIFTLPELTIFFTEHPLAVDVATERFSGDIGEFGRHLLAGSDVPQSTERRAGELLQRRITDLQMTDRQYWRNIISELKGLRAAGKLMPDGAKV